MNGNQAFTVLAYLTGAAMVFYAFAHPTQVSQLVTGTLTGFRQYIVGLATLSNG